VYKFYFAAARLLLEPLHFVHVAPRHNTELPSTPALV